MEEVSQVPTEDSSSKPRQKESSDILSKNGAEKKNIINWLKKSVMRKSTVDATLRDELEEIIQEHEESGEATREENLIIRNVLNFSEIKVSDVMTPRPDIHAIAKDTKLPELIAYILESEHTRLPVYRDNLDDVIGFLHIKDLLKYWGDGVNFQVTDILRDILFVPPSMKITKLLEKMKLNRTHMAVVVDEYGGTDGLVTIEDLMEEIVGDIEDEHDEEQEELLKTIGENIYEVSARLEVEELEDQLERKLREEDDDYDTIGGLIFTHMGKVPVAGEILEHPSGVRFEVLEADNRKIERVRVTLFEPVIESEAE